LSNSNIYLIEPTSRLRDDFYSLAEELSAEGNQQYKDAIRDFEKFLQFCADETAGRNLAPDRVPQSTFWLVEDDQRILGCSRLRHRLNAFLEDFGGHIGYEIRPSVRRQGYGTHIFRLTLDKARDLGLRQVLVTADSSNIGSWRIIEKNGGVLDSEAVSPHTGQLLRKYWIAL
jgi:predicted acetyltransferase